MPADLAAYAHCEALVREGDPEAWLAALFAPAALRPHLHAVWAFGVELARVPGRTRQPLAGEIRLRWWGDAVEDPARGDVAAHPVAAALLDTVARRHVPMASLEGAIEAHRLMLYPEPMPDLPALERHLDAISLIGPAAAVLAGPPIAGSQAVREAGVARGIAELLRGLAGDRGQARFLVPDELLRRHGATRGEVEAGIATEGVHKALRDLRATARDRLGALRVHPAGIPAEALPAFLPVSLVEPVLRASERPGVDPFARPLRLAPWRRHWILWRAARRGRVA